MNDIDIARKDRIIECHNQIHDSMKAALDYALEAGQLLTEQKEELNHGEFLPWLKENMPFEQPTAWRYMKLYEHQNKLFSVNNLQEAYRQIETIEKQENQSELQRAYKRIEEYKKTGNKPDGWRRGTDDKLYQEEIERQERIERSKQKIEEEMKQKEQKKEERQKFYEDLKSDTSFLNQAADMFLENSKKRREFKERIKISQSGESDVFIDALMDYLEELEDDNRRIEACQNIIKVCRNISVELQRK